jgi:hypothetical protein
LILLTEEEEKTVTKYLASSSLRLERQEHIWLAYLQLSFLSNLKRKKNELN